MNQIIHLLDSLKLPFDLPLLLHPPIVHFAIAIPIIALLLEISNLALKRRCIGVISGLLLALAGIIYFAAFFTGKTDGSEAYSLLSSEGQAELKEHKTLGIYLVYGIWIVLILKLIFMAIQKFWAKAAFAVILAGFVAAALVQGKDGGELVYKYGANNQAVSDMDDKIMELEDEVDTLKTQKEECEAKLKALEQNASTKETATPVTQPTEIQKKSEPPTIQSSGASTEANTTSEEKAKQALQQIKGENNTTQEQSH